MSALLPRSWPDTARDILIEAARHYYQEMKGPFPVADVLMDEAIAWVNAQLAQRQAEIYAESSARWIKRWESGQLDDETRRAIEQTYQRLSRVERGVRKRPVKKTSRQLAADIAESLSGTRGKL